MEQQARWAPAAWPEGEVMEFLAESEPNLKRPQ